MSKVRIDQRVVGGDFVKEDNKYSFMATIWGYDGSFRCGAVYIGKRFFLTSAHGLRDMNIGDIIVRMGSNSLLNLTFSGLAVKKFIHPLFNNLTLHNDIAILEIDRDVNFGSVRLPCEHMGNDLYKIGSMVKVLGFGKESENSLELHSMNLKEVDLRIVALEDSRYHREMIGSDMFLAVNRISGRIVDACTGDSGGPCLKSIKGQWVLVGIVSWGHGCGRDGFPGVYTDIMYFDNWVRSICGFDKCKNHV
jgi:secreted trypsin-like serine protease